MIRYGAQTETMRPMPTRKLFILRLKLLVIMTKAYLKGHPLGEFRKKAIVENADFIFSEALLRSEQLNKSGPEEKRQSTFQSHSKKSGHLVLQRILLLAVMANSFAKNKVDGNFRKQAMADNVELICEHLTEKVSLVDAKFLNVV